MQITLVLNFSKKNTKICPLKMLYKQKCLNRMNFQIFVRHLKYLININCPNLKNLKIYLKIFEIPIFFMK